MRVIHVITRLIVGGAQENTIASVLSLRQKPGLQVQLISGPTTGPEGSLEAAFANLPDALTIVDSLVRPIRPWQDIRAWRELVRLFRDRRPDMVHTHSGKAGILGRLAARRAGVPVIVHTIHGPSFGAFQGTVSNICLRGAERYAGRVTTHFVSVSDAMTRQYLAAGIGRPEDYTTIFSGFPLQPFLSATNDATLRTKWGLSAHDIVVGKIARLFKLKGHDDLLDVAPELVRRELHIKFLLVGDGAWRQRLEQRVKSLRLESHFIFTGLLPPEEIPGVLGIMDILVHLSRREGLARALPMAAAAGRSLVAYDCDGANEICVGNETGFLVQVGDLATLTDRLARLAGDAKLRQQLGRRGRELARSRFSVEKMVDDLHALYLKLGAEHGIQPS